MLLARAKSYGNYLKECPHLELDRSTFACSQFLLCALAFAVSVSLPPSFPHAHTPTCPCPPARPPARPAGVGPLRLQPCPHLHLHSLSLSLSFSLSLPPSSVSLFVIPSIRPFVCTSVFCFAAFSMRKLRNLWKRLKSQAIDWRFGMARDPALMI